MHKALALLALAAAAAAFEIKVVGNISQSKFDEHCAYRATGLLPFAVDTAATGGLFYSLTADAAAELIWGKGKANASANTIASYGGVTVGTVPMTWYAYFSGAVNAGFDAKSISGIANLDMSAGFMGTIYPALIERDKDGQEVHVTNLMSSSIVAVLTGGLSYKLDAKGETAEGLKWMRVAGTTPRSKLQVFFTFIVSDVAAITDYGHAVLTPRTMETVVEIRDYPYAAPENTIELKIVAASASATAKGSALVADGEAKVFVDLAAHAEFDGNTADATIKAWAKVDDTGAFADSDIAAWVKKASKGGVQAFEAYVRFKAGASVIVYDPALGTGTSVYDYSATSAAPAVFPALLALLAAFIRLL